jgi:hypothetical protein
VTPLEPLFAGRLSFIGTSSLIRESKEAAGLVRGNDNVPDVTAFGDPDGHHVSNSWETTMWNVLMVGYWACVAIPVVILCGGIVTAFRGVARQSDASDQWGS